MNEFQPPAKVLVLGGGFGGMEAATYLEAKAPGRAEITLVSSDDRFLFRPNTIYIPFGLDEKKLRFPLAKALGKKGIAFEHATAKEIDVDAKAVSVERAGGGTARFTYDYLVISTGAGMRPAEIPGLAEYGHNPWTPDDMRRLGAGFRSLVEKARAQQRSRVVFLVPPENKCSGPLYELVFMLDTWLRRQQVRDWITISWTTFEKTFIQAFGPKMHPYMVEDFLRRGIDAHNEWVVERVEAGAVHFTNGESMPYDLLVTFPPYVAGNQYAGLPADDRGFLLTEDLGSRRLRGHPDVLVPGDAGDFPIKQAFLAFLQADGAAEAIAADLLGTVPDYAFDPVSMCVMEQYDKALFAQVPLALTGDPAAPVRIREGSEGLYKIGVSKPWRLGKVALGYYLPFRFKAGNPFHAGTPWDVMEVMLRGMSAVLAK